MKKSKNKISKIARIQKGSFKCRDLNVFEIIERLKNLGFTEEDFKNAGIDSDLKYQAYYESDPPSQIVSVNWPDIF